MNLKVWDVREKKVLAEKTILQSRAIGYLEQLPGNKVLVSFNDKKQKVIIFDEKLEQVAEREFESDPTPIKMRYHFSGVLLGQTC